MPPIASMVSLCAASCYPPDTTSEVADAADRVAVVWHRIDKASSPTLFPGLPRFEITHLEVESSARVPTCVGLGKKDCPTLIYAATHSQGMWRLDLAVSRFSRREKGRGPHPCGPRPLTKSIEAAQYRLVHEGARGGSLVSARGGNLENE